MAILLTIPEIALPVHEWCKLGTSRYALDCVRVASADGHCTIAATDGAMAIEIAWEEHVADTTLFVPKLLWLHAAESAMLWHMQLSSPDTRFYVASTRKGYELCGKDNRGRIAWHIPIKDDAERKFPDFGAVFGQCVEYPTRIAMGLLKRIAMLPAAGRGKVAEETHQHWDFHLGASQETSGKALLLTTVVPPYTVRVAMMPIAIPIE